MVLRRKIAGSTPIELAEAFADVARALQAEPDVAQTLERIVQLAVKTIDGADDAAVTIVAAGTVRTDAATGDVPQQVDRIQYETGEGPCLDAIRDHGVFQVERLADEQRWPNFSRRASEETGIQSMLSFRLFVEEDTLGALNLYSRREAAFAECDPQAIGAVFAAHAAVALSGAQHDAQMEEALRSRELIGRAKGILMARENISAEEAFDRLRVTSQHLNVKLRVVAERVDWTGELPAVGEAIRRRPAPAGGTTPPASRRWPGR